MEKKAVVTKVEELLGGKGTVLYFDYHSDYMNLYTR